ncbi:hypothetical protein GCK72_000450 [Caenorhabditis remanei]|uniref:Homeobox domain-containing protein n=1 Tax=Caenorhabditis remanei TaxID=31234 RepID=A0A6A5HL68_CAERE|nr:hypothetical protein GCK72_000450 [Caenorhabditis remanei]KAF1768638.1 hypothetical protein GCK72_000450 [Caenorhabditis remanei]
MEYCFDLYNLYFKSDHLNTNSLVVNQTLPALSEDDVKSVLDEIPAFPDDQPQPKLLSVQNPGFENLHTTSFVVPTNVMTIVGNIGAPKRMKQFLKKVSDSQQLGPQEPQPNRETPHLRAQCYPYSSPAHYQVASEIYKPLLSSHSGGELQFRRPNPNQSVLPEPQQYQKQAYHWPETIISEFQPAAGAYDYQSYMTSALANYSQYTIKPRRKRTKFTETQLSVLEAKFQENNYISMKERNDLAEELKLNPMTVKNWFKNRKVLQKKRRTLSGNCWQPSSRNDE